ncbi:hypothetical protein EHQ24_12500 [Leptospira noumeaensis]|uniref:DUF4935 domain-containing protein n=1 Tax=Leptospira noumeaensis TaxID=2484964 RepID=A0A4R9I8J7_9LEPT|nr:hypothetical protein [Leptospira noumeaensis]TGK82086.1 hypothetical protein EHQ24_12500 [Leptospira noumeaensis]
MYITFDSSILISDYYLNSKIAELFLENHEMCGYKLLISNVAIEETINKFSEEIKKFNELNKRNLQFILKEYLNSIPQNIIEDLTNKYRYFLNKKFTYSKERPKKPETLAFIFIKI